MISLTKKEQSALKRKEKIEKIAIHIFRYSKIYGGIGYVVCILSGVFSEKLANLICNISGGIDVISKFLAIMYILFIIIPFFLCAVARTHLLFLEISMDMDELNKQKRSEKNA